MDFKSVVIRPKPVAVESTTLRMANSAKSMKMRDSLNCANCDLKLRSAQRKVALIIQVRNNGIHWVIDAKSCQELHPGPIT